MRYLAAALALVAVAAYTSGCCCCGPVPTDTNLLAPTTPMRSALPHLERPTVTASASTTQRF